jgi:hypothetical protein
MNQLRQKAAIQIQVNSCPTAAVLIFTTDLVDSREYDRETDILDCVS